MRGDDFYNIPSHLINKDQPDFIYPESYVNAEGKIKENYEISRFWGQNNADFSPYHFSIKKELKMKPICWTLLEEILSDNLDKKPKSDDIIARYK